jgi:nitroreductase
MDTFTALHTRRSIRNFTDQAVSEEALHALLDAAMIAPSAGNAQPWQYIVVDDAAILRQVPDINPYAGMAPKAPVSIVVCGDLSAEKYQGFWVQDCSAAIQNMLLAATALGLGTVWTGIHPMRDRVSAFQQLLKLPEHIVPLGLIVIGHPAAPFEKKSRFDAAKIHHNFWGTARVFAG